MNTALIRRDDRLFIEKPLGDADFATSRAHLSRRNGAGLACCWLIPVQALV